LRRCRSSSARPTASRVEGRKFSIITCSRDEVEE
jgi:hypothetical protein